MTHSVEKVCDKVKSVTFVVIFLLLLVRDASAHHVLVIASDGQPEIDDVKVKLEGTGVFTSVGQGNTTPTLEQLRPYAAVLVWSNDPHFPVDGEPLGNVLADYVDCGGGVVVAMFAHLTDASLEGRWVTGGYEPIYQSAGWSGSNLGLGEILVKGHPVMDGVTDFRGGSSSYYGTGAITPGAVQIANWNASIPQPLVVERPGFAGRIIGLNFYPVSTDVIFYGWAAGGTKLLVNALQYVMDTTAPTGTLDAPTADAGAPVTIHATASCTATASLYYRKPGGSSDFDLLPMAESSPGAGDWRATIPGADVGEDGAQYYVELSDGRNTSTLPPNVPDTYASVRVNRAATLPLVGGSYVMAGIPFAPSDPAPQAVFDELGPYNKKVWRYGTYDATSGTYREPPAAEGVTPGQGFWIIAKDTRSIIAGGRSTDLASNQRVTLKVGFNQIANPYSFPINVADLILPPGVERNCISWSSSGYIAGNATLSPMVGYWIRNNGPGDQIMEFPVVTGSGIPRAAPLLASLGAVESGWSVRVSAKAGEFADNWNYFGMRPGATDGKDEFDFSDPPPPPFGYVAISLVDKTGIPLMSDYRAEDGDGSRWSLSLSSDQAGKPFEIAFVTERDLPPGWELVALGPGGLRSIDLLSENVISGFVGEDPFHREWTIAAGPSPWIERVRDQLGNEAKTFDLSGPIPNPGPAPALDLSLPNPGPVSIRVYDLGGRLVRTLVDAQMSKGHHSIMWNGDDANGRRVVDGVYFVRVQTEDRNESRKILLRQ